MTHQEFADAVGVSRGAVQQWERGLTAPTRKRQPAVADYMGISVAELMQGTTTPPALGGGSAGPVSPELGIEAIANALALMTDEQREAMAGKLASLARAPDSPTLKKSISESLASSTKKPDPP